MTSRDARAGLLWTVAAVAFAIKVKDPVSLALIVAISWQVARLSTERRQFRMAALVGTFFILVRMVLFGLTGHAGETLLAEIPSVTLVPLFGGFQIGGPIYADVVASAATEGLRTMAILCAIGAFLSITDPLDLIRLIPRRMFDLGLILNIAVVFAPQMSRTMRDISEAQMMRGSSRGVSQRLMPVLATALERSMDLAESMDSRGFGRSPDTDGDQRSWRWVLIVSVVILSLAAVLMMAGIPMAGVVAGAAAVAAALALQRTGSAQKRSVYRAWRATARDRVVMAASSLALSSLVVISVLKQESQAATRPLVPDDLVVVTFMILLTVPCWAWAMRSR